MSPDLPPWLTVDDLAARRQALGAGIARPTLDAEKRALRRAFAAIEASDPAAVRRVPDGPGRPPLRVRTDAYLRWAGLVAGDLAPAEPAITRAA